MEDRDGSDLEREGHKQGPFQSKKEERKSAKSALPGIQGSAVDRKSKHIPVRHSPPISHQTRVTGHTVSREDLIPDTSSLVSGPRSTRNNNTFSPEVSCQMEVV